MDVSRRRAVGLWKSALLEQLLGDGRLVHSDRPPDVYVRQGVADFEGLGAADAEHLLQVSRSRSFRPVPERRVVPEPCYLSDPLCALAFHGDLCPLRPPWVPM